MYNLTMKNKRQIEGLAVKIDSDLYIELRGLSIRKGTKIKWLLDKAVKNYLKARKILKE